MCTRNPSRSLTRADPLTIWVRPNESSPCPDEKKTTKLCAERGSQANPALFDEVSELLDKYDLNETILVRLLAGTHGNVGTTYDFRNRSISLTGDGSAVTTLLGSQLLLGRTPQFTTQPKQVTYATTTAVSNITILPQTIYVTQSEPRRGATRVASPQAHSFSIQDCRLINAPVTIETGGDVTNVVLNKNTYVLTHGQMGLGVTASGGATLTLTESDSLYEDVWDVESNTPMTSYTVTGHATLAQYSSNSKTLGKRPGLVAENTVKDNGNLVVKDNGTSYENHGGLFRTTVQDSGTVSTTVSNSTAMSRNGVINTNIINDNGKIIETISNTVERVLENGGSFENTSGTANANYTRRHTTVPKTYVSDKPSASPLISRSFSGAAQASITCDGNNESAILENGVPFAQSVLTDSASVTHLLRICDATLPSGNGAVVDVGDSATYIRSEFGRQMDIPFGTLLTVHQSSESTVNTTMSQIQHTGLVGVNLDATSTAPGATTVQRFDGVQSTIKGQFLNVHGGEGQVQTAVSNSAILSENAPRHAQDDRLWATIQVTGPERNTRQTFNLDNTTVQSNHGGPGLHVRHTVANIASSRLVNTSTEYPTILLEDAVSKIVTSQIKNDNGGCIHVSKTVSSRAMTTPQLDLDVSSSQLDANGNVIDVLETSSQPVDVHANQVRADAPDGHKLLAVPDCLMATLTTGSNSLIGGAGAVSHQVVVVETVNIPK